MTAVPTMAMYLLKPHDEAHHDAKGGNTLARIQLKFEAGFKGCANRIATYSLY